MGLHLALHVAVVEVEAVEIGVDRVDRRLVLQGGGAGIEGARARGPGCAGARTPELLFCGTVRRRTAARPTRPRKSAQHRLLVRSSPPSSADAAAEMSLRSSPRISGTAPAALPCLTARWTGARHRLALPVRSVPAPCPKSWPSSTRSCSVFTRSSAAVASTWAPLREPRGRRVLPATSAIWRSRRMRSSMARKVSQRPLSMAWLTSASRVLKEKAWPVWQRKRTTLPSSI